MKQFLRKIHHKIPKQLREFYSPFLWNLVDFINKYIKTIFQARQSLYVFEGQTPIDGHPLVIAYFGQTSTVKAYWSQRMLAPGFKTHQLGAHWVWNILDALKKTTFDYSILFKETNCFIEVFINTKQSFKIPAWLQVGLDISKPFSEMSLKEKRGFYDIERRIRKNKLDYEIKNDPEAFDDFYFKMHIPYIKNRFSETAIFYTDQEAKKIFNQSDLLLVKKDNEVLGGILIDYTQRLAKIRLIGMKQDDGSAVRMGTIGALYYFSILELQKKNYKHLDIGGTSPLFSDGLTQFKLSFNPRIIPFTHIKKRCLQMSIPKINPAIQNFLIENPFAFYLNESKPSRALFIDTNKTTKINEFKKMFVKSYCQGLKQTMIYVWGDVEQVLKWVKELNLVDTKVYPAAKCFAA